MRSLQCPSDEQIPLGRGRIESAPALTAIHSRQSLRPSRVYLSWVLQAGKQPSDSTNWEEKPHVEPLQLGDPLDSGPRQLSAIRIDEEHATPVPVFSWPKSTQECIGFVHLRVNVSVLVLVTQLLQLPKSLEMIPAGSRAECLDETDRTLSSRRPVAASSSSQAVPAAPARSSRRRGRGAWRRCSRPACDGCRSCSTAAATALRHSSCRSLLTPACTPSWDSR